jgi:hypothetical protein
MPGDLGAYWKSIARGRDFHVQAVVHERRDPAIAHARDAVLRHRGDILDFKMFSNLSLAMIVELEAGGLLALLDSLVALGWSVEVDPGRELLARRAAERLEGTLQLTFPDGDGELEIPQPAVPG